MLEFRFQALLLIFHELCARIREIQAGTPQRMHAHMK
jgi:hypothetical protein